MEGRSRVDGKRPIRPLRRRSGTHFRKAFGFALTEETSNQLLDTERATQLFLRLPDEPKVRDELILLYRPLAKYLARRFRNRGEQLEDLIQVATVALIKALDRFDSERGVKFSTYATATIVGEIKRHFRDKGWALRVPRRLQETGLQVSRTVTDLSQNLGRSPTIREIAAETGLRDEEVIEAMDSAHAYSTMSLDVPSEDGGRNPLLDLPQEDEAIEIMEAWAAVGPAIQALPPREQHILYLRFFRGLTQTQIADELNLSQMHVSRLLSKTLRALREKVGDVA